MRNHDLAWWLLVGSVVTVWAGVAAGTYRWVVRPVYKTLRRLNEVADELLGDTRKGIPSIGQRVTAIEEMMRKHEADHRPANMRAIGPSTQRRRA